MFVLIFLCLLENAWTFLSGAATFSQGTKIGTVHDHSIKDGSGLASSKLHHQVFYTHNDHGGKSRIFAIAYNGTLLATLEIEHASNNDWEDIATGKCPDGTASKCIYIGDIGNHAGKKTIYVVKEPTVLHSSHLNPIRTLHFSWHERDVDTLMVDPSGNVILVSKVDGGIGEVGFIPASAFSSSSTFTITDRSSLDIPPTKHQDPLGGDISPDGTEVIIRTHEKLFYWKIRDSDYVLGLSSVRGTEVPVHREHQGEAVAWNALGTGYYSFSEGKNEPIYYYKRL